MGAIEETDLYRRASLLSDSVYEAVAKWPSLAQRTFGTQLIDSLDSVGANLVEGDGRGPGLDAIRFFRIARGSCREARHWLSRAKARRTLPQETAEAWVREAIEIAKMINGLIAHRKDILPKVRETSAEYDAYDDPAADPFTPNSLNSLNSLTP